MPLGPDMRPDTPLYADSVEMVLAFLDFQRATLLWKMEGLTDGQLRQAMVPSGTSLLAMLKHCAYVERWWFQYVFAGEEDTDVPWMNDDADADWRLEPGEDFESLKKIYLDQIGISRRICTGVTWDRLAKYEPQARSFGWVATHMLEEVARHVGQADILREMLDESVGE